MLGIGACAIACCGAHPGELRSAAQPGAARWSASETHAAYVRSVVDPAAAVSQPAGHRPQVDAGSDQLGCRVVPQLVQVVSMPSRSTEPARTAASPTSGTRCVDAVRRRREHERLAASSMPSSAARARHRSRCSASTPTVSASSAIRRCWWVLVSFSSGSPTVLRDRPPELIDTVPRRDRGPTSAARTARRAAPRSSPSSQTSAPHSGSSQAPRRSARPPRRRRSRVGPCAAGVGLRDRIRRPTASAHPSVRAAEHEWTWRIADDDRARRRAVGTLIALVLPRRPVVGPALARAVPRGTDAARRTRSPASRLRPRRLQPPDERADVLVQVRRGTSRALWGRPSSVSRYRSSSWSSVALVRGLRRSSTW